MTMHMNRNRKQVRPQPDYKSKGSTERCSETLTIPAAKEKYFRNGKYLDWSNIQARETNLISSHIRRRRRPTRRARGLE